MSNVNKGLILATIASLGLWGCAKGPANISGASERIKALEFKIGKLEDDFRAAASARDSVRKKLADVETQLQQQSDQLRSVVKERDELRRQVVARTTERDSIQVQYEQFRKGLRDLLGQAEAALGNGSSQPVTAATAAPAKAQSVE
jgi:septal ring factor EnvC (AmiA/AmiB activator)